MKILLWRDQALLLCRRLYSDGWLLARLVQVLLAQQLVDVVDGVGHVGHSGVAVVELQLDADKDGGDFAHDLAQLVEALHPVGDVEGTAERLDKVL